MSSLLSLGEFSHVMSNVSLLTRSCSHSHNNIILQELLLPHILAFNSCFTPGECRQSLNELFFYNVSWIINIYSQTADEVIITFNMNRSDILLRLHCKIFLQGPLQVQIIGKSLTKTSVTLDSQAKEDLIQRIRGVQDFQELHFPKVQMC